MKIEIEMELELEEDKMYYWYQTTVNGKFHTLGSRQDEAENRARYMFGKDVEISYKKH